MVGKAGLKIEEQLPMQTPIRLQQLLLRQQKKACLSSCPSKKPGFYPGFFIANQKLLIHALIWCILAYRPSLGALTLWQKPNFIGSHQSLNIWFGNCMSGDSRMVEGVSLK